jgi:hypothetical protein
VFFGCKIRIRKADPLLLKASLVGRDSRGRTARTQGPDLRGPNLTAVGLRALLDAGKLGLSVAESSHCGGLLSPRRSRFKKDDFRTFWKLSKSKTRKYTQDFRTRMQACKQAGGVTPSLMEHSRGARWSGCEVRGSQKKDHCEPQGVEKMLGRHKVPATNRRASNCFARTGSVRHD